MLFQPSNVYPSDTGGIGNGVCDVNQDLTVSWQVNGSSALAAFSITIYKNNTASEQVYTTGKLTQGCPFYGVDRNGDVQLFEFTIPSASLISAGMVNGGNYKLIITQWWSEDDYVTQTSASAFITRSAPVLSLPGLPISISSRFYTFTAQYSQAQGDAVMWFQWELMDDNSGEIIYDTGRVYGSAQISMYYDLFFSGMYAVRCTVMTENGVQAIAGWAWFSVSYDLSEVAGLVSACNRCGNVFLNWSRVSYINGEADGEYTTSGQKLSLPAGSSVVWDTVNKEPMAFSPPFTLVWKGVINTGTPVAVEMSTGKLEIIVENSSAQVSVAGDVIYSALLSGISGQKEMLVIITPTKVYVQAIGEFGGLYPNTSLFPAQSLSPKESFSKLFGTSGEVEYEQGVISSVALFGAQVCEYLWLFAGEAEQETIDELLYHPDFTPQIDAGTYMLANFKYGLNAGTLLTSGQEPTGVSIYRKRGEAPLVFVAELPLSVTSLIDYGTANQESYVYYLFPVSSDAFMSAPLVSNEVTAFGWDWSVVVCGDDGGALHMEAVYLFGKNFQSSAVSNNNSPALFENFTPFPLIQLSPVNYMSGSLTSFIGAIKDGEYTDSLRLRDEIFALGNSQKEMYLKSRKGDVVKIRVLGPVEMSTWDETREQALSVTLPWAQIGEEAEAVIISTPEDAAWPLSANG